ncbi:MAG TPA: hypothetical protein VFA84_05390 [Acidimicrobiales bacterium]|nr:hypothetical protein [Acidimicrobiales bacterium]
MASEHATPGVRLVEGAPHYSAAWLGREGEELTEAELLELDASVLRREGLVASAVRKLRITRDLDDLTGEEVSALAAVLVARLGDGVAA